MTNGQVVETPKRRGLSPTERAGLVFAILLGVGALLNWVDDSPPRWWFYPLLIVLSAIAAAIAFWKPFSSVPPKPGPPESVEEALGFAVMAGVVGGLAAFFIFWLLEGEARKAWQVPLGMGVFGALDRFSKGRKHAHPRLTQFALAAIVLVALVIAKILRHRG